MKQVGQLMALSIIGSMFFVVGFALGINSYIVPLLQEALDVTSGQSYLILAATFSAFLLFSYPATSLILKIGYKKTMAAAFAAFAVGFLLFIPSAKTSSLPLFLLASFICGTGNTVLQAAINPYATFLGPIESAARRISIMGICNIVAWPVAPLFLSWLVGKELSQMSIEDIVAPFIVIATVFTALGIFIICSPLKEIPLQGDDGLSAEDLAEPVGKKTILRFPHLILGAVALFMYVGVETIAMAASVDYAVGLGLSSPEKYAIVPSLGMVLGYLAAIILIPKYLSQSKALRLHSWVAIVGTLMVVLLPARWSILSVAVVTFGCSVMYPAIWPLALEGLGRFTKTGSSILVSCIAGGAVLPLLFGLLKDWSSDPQAPYWIALPCFAFVLYYAYFGSGKQRSRRDGSGRR